VFEQVGAEDTVEFGIAERKVERVGLRAGMASLAAVSSVSSMSIATAVVPAFVRARV
jgi:hypothetical protein